ncbi:MAG TPA: histidine kinase, partial [Bacteroidales bacterium]|nr:histidine kinase [Bacteroidales bacterium]
NLEKQSTISEIETQYETEKKEQQIELLSAENRIKNQRIKFGIVTISGLLLLIVVIISLMIIRRRNAQLAHDDLKQKLFRSQMNPHFIFNALGSIQNYMYKNKTKKAARFLGNFASLSRSILKYSDENIIDLDSEIEMLKNYIELEKMRMPDVFNYEIKTDKDLETEFIQIAPMMIQPFVENAIKHGFCDKKDGGKLKVEFIDKKDLLEVIITDNGIGINHSKQKSKHESMSTKIFYDRMKYLKKKNKHIPDIEIKDRTDEETRGTKVVLYLPILN